jgi:mono/diheme cytochrome c family protein
MTEPTGPRTDAAPPTRKARTEKEWTVIIVAIALGLILFSLVYLGPDRKKGATQDAPTAPTQVTPESVPLVTGEEPLQAIFTKAGCAVCHTIPGVAGADGRVGPKLVLGTTAPQRLADPTYKGSARTVREYIVESILSPGAYVVPGFPPRAMPRWYGQKLSATALDKIAAYLEQQRETDPPAGS